MHFLKNFNPAEHFSPQNTYLNTATVGLPCHASLTAMQQDITNWQHGELDPLRYDTLITRCRALFAGLLGVSADWVAVGNQVSPFVGLLAQSLSPGARVLAADNDFTSVLFPFFVRQPEITVELCALDEIPERLGQGEPYDWVALSAVQSANGAVAALDAISAQAAAQGTRVMLDATHALSWLDIKPQHWDMLICGAYKWLLSPRGTGFMALRPELMAGIAPLMANWYAGEDIWTAIYSAPLRLAKTARRYDISPAWLPWVGTLPALELISDLGVVNIGAHNVALANSLRHALGMPESDSALVSLQRDGVDKKLQQANIAASVRAGAARLSFHLYNTEADVERVLRVL